MLLELYTFSRIIEIYENVEKKNANKGNAQLLFFVCFFSLSYTFFISRDFVYRGGFLYELIDV